MNNHTQFVLAAELFAIMEPVLKEGKSAVFHVSGMSMWPFICHNRDSVVVKAVDPGTLKVGDIVLFCVPEYNKYILHRIIRLNKEKGSFQTAGDSNCFYDGWFPLECAVAIVTEIVYKGKTIPVTDFKYRLLSTIWRLCYPVRKPLLRFLLSIAEMKRKIRKIIK